MKPLSQKTYDALYSRASMRAQYNRAGRAHVSFGVSPNLIERFLETLIVIGLA